MNSSFACLDESGEICAKDFRGCLSNILCNDSLCLKSPLANMTFNNNNDAMIELTEDTVCFTQSIISEILKGSHLTGEDAEELRRISRNMSSMYIRMRNLRELASAKNSSDIDFCMVNMLDFLNAFMRTVRRTLPAGLSTNIHLINGTRKEVYCAGNPAMLTIILVNLLHNALTHAHSKSGHVDLIFNRYTKNKYITISVVDYGVGVDIKRIRKIMDSSVSEYGNSYGFLNRYKGLGLLVCQRLASLLFGNIIVSNIEGGGAVFTLLLRDAEALGKTGLVRLNDAEAGGSNPDDNDIIFALRQFSEDVVKDDHAYGMSDESKSIESKSIEELVCKEYEEVNDERS